MTGLGVWVMCGLVLAVVLTGRFVKSRAPLWYWYVFGYPLVWVRMMATWKRLCLECDLTTRRTSGNALVGSLMVRGQDVVPITPRLWVGRPTRLGLEAQVRLLPGQKPEQYELVADAMEHAWRVFGVRVTSPRRGFVRIVVRIVDPLGGPGSGRGLPDPLGPDGLPLVSRIPLNPRVGKSEDGEPWVMDLRRLPHWLIVGRTRSGKSTLLHALASALMPWPVAVVAIDLKGGLELSVYSERLTGFANTLKRAESLLTGLLGVVVDRMAVCLAAGVTSIDDVPGVYPHIVVMVDEIAELYLTGGSREEKALSESATSTLVRLGQLGAALGLHLVIGAQRFGTALGPKVTTLRAQLPGRVCLAVSDAESAEMVFGDVYPEAVRAAQMITSLHKGYAVTTTDDGGWMRVRSDLVTRVDAGALAHQHMDMAMALPGVDSTAWALDGGDEE
jgi:DNA segregation ATPase FtsK/SpoIIIE, S-DNA-T family